MNDADIQTAIKLLVEIRDNQRIQLERQMESIQMQREQFAIFQKQADRAEAIQKRSEAIQEKCAQIVGGARKMLIIILPIILILIAYVSWLMFR
jgi:hypothetical protein